MASRLGQCEIETNVKLTEIKEMCATKLSCDGFKMAISKEISMKDVLIQLKRKYIKRHEQIPCYT